MIHLNCIPRVQSMVTYYPPGPPVMRRTGGGRWNMTQVFLELILDPGRRRSVCKKHPDPSSLPSLSSRGIGIFRQVKRNPWD
jgi:hypothetical protein